MLSLPDFKEKQLLIVRANDITNDAILFRNDNIRIDRDGKRINQLSCHKVFALFVVGECTLTTALIRKCQEYGIGLFLLKSNFLCYAEINSLAAGNYLLREKQYAQSDEAMLLSAKALIKNKIQNQYFLLKQKKIAVPKEWLAAKFSRVAIATHSAELRGIEGDASKFFYTQYFESIGWLRRMPRAKTDIPNVLLDIGYTFLFNFIDSLLSLHGFDSYKGVYHTLFFQRKSLACDIMEPFRCIVDKALVKAFNLQQIDKKDFFVKNDVWFLAYQNQQKYTRIFAEALMKNKEDIFQYVRKYYYHVLNNDPAEIPTFNIK